MVRSFSKRHRFSSIRIASFFYVVEASTTVGDVRHSIHLMILLPARFFLLLTF